MSSIPLPRPTDISRPFWDACREGRLTFQRCAACGAPIFIPLPCCNRCLSLDLSWETSSGRGTVYSWSSVWRPQQAGFEPGYVAAIVEMEEGWRTLTNIIECAPDAVYVGMPVVVAFREMSPQISLPYFRPQSQHEGPGGER